MATTIELNDGEVRLLRELLEKVGGPHDGPRGFADSIYRKLPVVKYVWKWTARDGGLYVEVVGAEL